MKKRAVEAVVVSEESMRSEWRGCVGGVRRPGFEGEIARLVPLKRGGKDVGSG